MASGGGSSRMPPRLHSRSNFTTRSAQDDSHQLQRRWSISQISSQDESDPLLAAGARQGRLRSASRGSEGFGTFFSNLLERGRTFVASTPASRAASVAPSLTPSGRRKHHGKHGHERAHSRGRASGADSSKSGNASSKLGTFAGVFVPTTLNILSILMFLRFGFILGQSGVLGMMGESRETGTVSLVSRGPPAANDGSRVRSMVRLCATWPSSGQLSGHEL